MPKFVKLFGERNTATNAIKALMDGVSDAHWLPATAAEVDADAFAQISAREPHQREAAIDAIFAEAGVRSAWKHCATTFDDATPFEDCLVIFTVRHPASWLAGLFANPYHALSPLPGSIPDFVDFAWRTVNRERFDGQTFTPLDLYHAKLRSYDSFSAKLERARIPFRFIRFEDVVLAQETVFRALATDLGQPEAAYSPLTLSTKDPARSLDDYRLYYGEQRWRERLAGLEQAINARVDWSLVSRFGYFPL